MHNVRRQLRDNECGKVGVGTERYKLSTRGRASSTILVALRLSIFLTWFLGHAGVHILPTSAETAILGRSFSPWPGSFPVKTQ